MAKHKTAKSQAILYDLAGKSSAIGGVRTFIDGVRTFIDDGGTFPPEVCRNHAPACKKSFATHSEMFK